MRRSARDLAAQVPDGLPGPVLVLGLAETAICLGQTVHAELRARTGRDDIFFIHSTRQQIDHPLLCRFEEPHSHASAHLVFRPTIPGFETPRSLVLIDDKLSTGTTLANLTAEIVRCWPGIDGICVATLTDWSTGEWRARMPRPTTSAALLRGALQWTPHAAVAASAAFDSAAASLGRMIRHRNFGRLGLRKAFCAPPDALPPEGAAPLRIIATGEFTYPAFLLAERMQSLGRDVVVQATSRSPVRLGGAIRTALRFGDNYGTGVPNYLYNVDAGDGRENWICHETPAGSIDPKLVAELDARLVGWTA